MLLRACPAASKAGLAARIQFGDDGPKVAQAIGGRDEGQDRDAETSNTPACWRVTVGKPARKSSIVSPASRYSKRVWTGTRVPAKTGAPPMMSGEMDIKCSPTRRSLRAKAPSLQVERYPVRRCGPRQGFGSRLQEEGCFGKANPSA